MSIQLLLLVASYGLLFFIGPLCIAYIIVLLGFIQGGGLSSAGSLLALLQSSGRLNSLIVVGFALGITASILSSIFGGMFLVVSIFLLIFGT
jgi:hypothetical protein